MGTISQNIEIILLIIQFAFVTAASMYKTKNDKGKPTKIGVVLIFGSLLTLIINIVLNIQKHTEEFNSKARQQELQHHVDSMQIALQSKILDSITFSLRQSATMLFNSSGIQDSLSYSLRQSSTILNQSKGIQEQTKASLIQQEILLLNTERTLNPIFPLTAEFTLTMPFSFFPDINDPASKFVDTFLKVRRGTKNDPIWEKYTEIWPGGKSIIMTHIQLKDNHPFFHVFDSLLQGTGLVYQIDFWSQDYSKTGTNWYDFGEITCMAYRNSFYKNENPQYSSWRVINIDLAMQKLSVTVHYPNLIQREGDSNSNIRGVNDLKGKYLCISTGNAKNLEYSLFRVTLYTGTNLSLKKELYLSRQKSITTYDGSKYYIYAW